MHDGRGILAEKAELINDDFSSYSVIIFEMNGKDVKTFI